MDNNRRLHPGSHIGGIGSQIAVFLTEGIGKLLIDIVVQAVCPLIALPQRHALSHNLYPDMVIPVQHQADPLILRHNKASGSLFLHHASVDQPPLL